MWFGLPLSSIAVSQALGAVNILILFLSAFVAMTTALVRLGRLIHLPLVWILVGVALLISRYDLNDNHIVRQTREDTTKALTVEDAFDQWMSSRADKDLFSEYPVILVSAEGGGIALHSLRRSRSPASPIAVPGWSATSLRSAECPAERSERRSLRPRSRHGPSMRRTRTAI